MSAITFALISITCYLSASVIIWRSSFHRSNMKLLSDGDAKAEDQSIRQRFMFISRGFAVLGLFAHIYYAWSAGYGGTSISLNLDSMVALVSISVVLIFIGGSLALDIHELGILVYPLAILCVVFSIVWQGTNEPLSDQLLYPLSLSSTHIIVSVLAYSLLAIATFQALLYSFQERQIRLKTKAAMLTMLPPLQSMKTLLFRLCWMGFALLSLTLVSGAVFSQQIFGIPFALKHHTILALAGWLVIAVMLYKQYRHGLNGRQASMWMVGGFLLVQLGYFGTKLVNEGLKVS